MKDSLYKSEIQVRSWGNECDLKCVIHLSKEDFNMEISCFNHTIFYTDITVFKRMLSVSLIR